MDIVPHDINLLKIIFQFIPKISYQIIFLMTCKKIYENIFKNIFKNILVTNIDHAKHLSPIRMKFFKYFRGEIKNKLPDSLEELDLGDNFNYPIDNILPNNLKKITLCCVFNSKII